MAVDVTDATFEKEVIEKSMTTPVLVDFWADWCTPCKMIAPILEELAKEQPGIQVAKLDVDANPEIAMRFNVMSIPTMIVFKNGAEVQRLVGARGKAALLADLAGHLG